MNIILLGPQGSGKGTIARSIYGKHGFAILGTGDLLREEIKKGTTLGKEIAARIDEGNMVSDELAFDLVKKSIERSRTGFILDGYPRNLKQAEMLENYLQDIEKKIDMVIYIHIEESTIKERLEGRLICSNCNHIYHTKVEELIPKTAGICDKCNKALVKREDEKPEAIKKRLAWYKEKVEPLRDYYKDKNILEVIDGEGEPSEVFERIEELIAQKATQ